MACAGDRELDIAANILTGPGGTLLTSLVRQGFAVSASARQSSGRRGSTFSVGAVVADGVDADEVRRGIERAIAALAAHVEPDAVDRAQRFFVRRSVARNETALGRAERLAGWEGAGDPWEIDPYADITADAVSSAVRSILVASNRVTALLLTSKTPLPRGTHAVVERREERSP